MAESLSAVDEPERERHTGEAAEPQEKLRSYDAQLAELRALRKRCENQEKELEKLRQHQRSPVDMEVDGEKPGKSDWWTKACQRAGTEVSGRELELLTTWRPEEGNRAAKEFDVVDEMNCLHGCFRCQGQPLPILEGVPQLDVSKCHRSASITARDLISTLVQPAAAHRVDCVLEGARVIAIWQGCGTLSEKIAWICDPLHRRITPRSVALSYAFFRSRCLHVSVMAGMVSADDIMRHWPIPGWHCDVPTIFELGWRISTRTTWKVAREAVGAEHRKMVIVVPDCLHRLKQVGGQLRDTKIFYYKQFRDIHLRKTELFDDQLGHVIIVLPPTEPKPGSWLSLVAAQAMWLQCGCRVYLVAGPRPQDLNSWYRVAIQARSHLNGFLEDHMELIPQVVDKLITENGLVDPTAPSYAVAVMENETGWLPERHVRLFHQYLSRHLAQYIALEPLPSPISPREDTSTGEPSRATGGRGHPAVKVGGVHKRTLRKQEQRKKRSQARAMAKNLEGLSLDRV